MMATMMAITVILHTNMGAITLELDQKNAPISTQNFIRYVEEGFYDNTIFHRVIDRFMVQGGGMTADMQSKETHAPIKNEANNGLKNAVGTIAMARTNEPHSASSQFFINVSDNKFLDFQSESTQGWGYAVFGKVTNGMDIVMKMSHVNTVNKSGHQDVPEHNIVIEKVEVLDTAKENVAQAAVAE